MGFALERSGSHPTPPGGSRIRTLGPSRQRGSAREIAGGSLEKSVSSPGTDGSNPWNASRNAGFVRPLGRVDDLPVWSLSCFFVRRGYRGQGHDRPLDRSRAQVRKERWCARSGSVPHRRTAPEGNPQSLYGHSVNIRKSRFPRRSATHAIAADPAPRRGKRPLGGALWRRLTRPWLGLAFRSRLSDGPLPN